MDRIDQVPSSLLNWMVGLKPSKNSPRPTCFKREDKLARRDKSALPFGDTARSIKAMRNNLYLLNKGVIPAFNPSPREATAITNDNIRKAAQAKNRRDTYAAFATAHSVATAKSLNR